MSQIPTLISKGDYFHGHFFCMASPCELLIETQDQLFANHLLQQVVAQTTRIEQKYSRYIAGNLVDRINRSNNSWVQIDQETHRLLAFAQTCFELSDGMFDLTSGVLRKIWDFTGKGQFPLPEQVANIIKHIGWQHIEFTEQHIRLPPGFELDFGGIGKEYAVDAAAKLCTELAPTVSTLVNFGGDIQVTQPRRHQAYWQVGIESPQRINASQQVVPCQQTENADQDTHAMVKIASGGLATSGDARRFIIHNNIRYSHILNPKTGYPVTGAPRSVTVATDFCIQSGMIATMALLQGSEAEHFLQTQQQKHWCYW